MSRSLKKAEPNRQGVQLCLHKKDIISIPMAENKPMYIQTIDPWYRFSVYDSRNRLQQMLIRLQKYALKVSFVLGKKCT